MHFGSMKLIYDIANTDTFRPLMWPSSG